jgi:hypothetical protein
VKGMKEKNIDLGEESKRTITLGHWII